MARETFSVPGILRVRPRIQKAPAELHTCKRERVIRRSGVLIEEGVPRGTLCVFIGVEVEEMGGGAPRWERLDAVRAPHSLPN